MEIGESEIAQELNQETEETSYKPHTLSQTLQQLKEDQNKDVFIFGVAHSDLKCKKNVETAIRNNVVGAMRLIIEGSPRFQRLLDIAFKTEDETERENALKEIKENAKKYELPGEYHRINTYLEAAKDGGIKEVFFADSSTWEIRLGVINNWAYLGEPQERNIAIANIIFGHTLSPDIPNYEDRSEKLTLEELGFEEELEVPSTTIAVMGRNHTPLCANFKHGDATELTVSALANTISGGKVAAINLFPEVPPGRLEKEHENYFVNTNDPDIPEKYKMFKNEFSAVILR